MITYTLLRIVILPAMRLDVSILGIFIEINIDTQFIMLVLAAMLTAAGADWLIRSHPDFHDSGTTARHWIIPGLAALGAGAILTGIPEGPALWVGLPVTSMMLMAILVTEFVVYNPLDTRRRAAGVILAGLSYLLLLGVFFAIQASSLRAAFAVPIGFLASTAVVWRLLNLTQPGKPVLVYAAAVGGCIAELVWALHYWPIPPLQSALFISVAAYAGNSITDAVIGEMLNRSRWFELGLVTSLALAAVLFLT